MYDNVLVPVSLNTEANKSVIDEAQKVTGKDSELHILTVKMTYMESKGEEELRRDILDKMHTYANDSTTFSDELIKTHMDSGKPSKVICKYAREYNVDSIIMATNAVEGFKRLAIGSVSGKTIQNAPCSVISIRKPQID